jgi:integrase
MGRKRAPENARLGQYVQRRADGKLELRYPIPEDVRFAFTDGNGQPRKQLIRQLKTSDVTLANERADLHRVQIRAEIAKANATKGAGDVSDHLRLVFNIIKEDLANEQADNERKRRESAKFGLPYEGRSPELVVATRQIYSRALLSADVDEKIATAGWAADLYFHNKEQLPNHSSSEYKDILDQCCAVIIEGNLAYIDVHSGRPEPTPEHPALASHPPKSEDGNIAKTERGRLSLQDYLDQCYVKEALARTGERTASVQRDAVKRFAKLIGDRPLYMISTSDCWSFADSLKMLPNPRLLNVRERALPFADQIAQRLDGRITAPPLHPRTVNKHLTGIRTILSHAQERGDILQNPADRVRAKDPGAGEKAGRSFTSAELQRIFSQPLFTGCLEGSSPLGLYKPGPVRIRDDRFWIPLLLLFTGARVAEIVGLAIEDVVIDHKVPHILIRKNDIRRIKNTHSRRMIPIHKELVELGFLRFVQAQQPRTIGQLFQMAIIPKYNDRTTGDIQEKSIANTLIMRDFNKYVLLHAKAKDNRGSAKCFRNTFEDAQRTAIESDEVRQRISGRRVTSSVIHYTDNIPNDDAVRDKVLIKLKDHIDRVEFPSIDLTALAPAGN